MSKDKDTNSGIKRQVGSRHLVPSWELEGSPPDIVKIEDVGHLTKEQQAAADNAWDCVSWEAADIGAVEPPTYCWSSDIGTVLLVVPMELDSDGVRVATFNGLDGKPAIRVRFGEGIEPEVLPNAPMEDRER